MLKIRTREVYDLLFLSIELDILFIYVKIKIDLEY